MLSSEFDRELRESLFIHRPLPLHREREMEAKFPEKEVLAVRKIGGEMSAEGCEISAGEEGVTITARLRSEPWPQADPGEVDYRNFGTARLTLRFPAESWEGYNRLRFSARPEMLGARVCHLNVAVFSDGDEPIPDRYFREGATVFDLENHAWNDCIWEFNAMPRDAVREIQFYVFRAGHDVAAEDLLRYCFQDIRLERVAEPEHERGWENPAPGIRLSSVGYWPQGAKTAVATTDSAEFSLVDSASGETVYTGPVQRVENERGRFAVLDFSSVTRPGVYALRAGEQRSCPFEIGEDIGEETLWKLLNFFFCQRCGTPVPGKHGTCHQDFIAEHGGALLSFAGGWHDAGDTSQQALQSGEVTLALFEAARRREAGSPLSLRLMEEAQWGLDFILRTRFGDGFRATSAGSTRWTDNRIGTFDDVKAVVHDHSFENFVFAGVEAAAAEALRGYDDNLADQAEKAAKEDFAFAREKYAETGVDPAGMFEHSFNSGFSQYEAVIVWSASLLYRLTGEEAYAQAAREHAQRLIACQEQGGAGIGVTGFFYRDESHKTPVHFNHQSREHQFMQALAALCESQPHHPDLPVWEAAMRRYGEYLKAIAGNTAPYGMLPAGIHRLDEAEDRETYYYLHIATQYDDEKENYAAQLAAGKPLGNGYTLRNFPVWFSFRGNSAVLLSMGKAAGILGGYFGDEELLRIAREQLYWMWGKNPFGQCLVYGAGHDFCRQYTVHMGDTVGSVPVGIETRGNEDVPYWPQNNNATFRELWISAACRFLQLLTEVSPRRGAPAGEG